MNKNIILTNLKEMINSLQVTIGQYDIFKHQNLNYINSLEDKKNRLLLRLENPNTYKVKSVKYVRLGILIKQIKSEQNTLSSLIDNIEQRTANSEDEINKNTSILSVEQQQIASLAQKMTDNDSVTLMKIKQKRAKLAELKQLISECTEEIKENDNDIKMYNEKIQALDVKLKKYTDEMKNISIFAIDEVKKNKDVNKYNSFLRTLEFIEAVVTLDEVYLELTHLYDLFNNNKVDSNSVIEQVGNLKTLISSSISTIDYFVKTTNIDELLAEKSIIEDRINSKNGYVLNDSEREMIYDEIASIKASISSIESDYKLDEKVISEYSEFVNTLTNEIDQKVNERNSLQEEVNDLNLKKSHSMKKVSQEQIDCISGEIKKIQRKIDNIEKTKDKYIETRADVKDIITFIKKKRRISLALKDSKVIDLNNIRENAFDKTTSKYDLNEDKQELIFTDFLVELVGIGKQFLSVDFVRQLDNIILGVTDTNIPVLNFSEYDDLAAIYSDEFIEQARETIDGLLDDQTTYVDDYIRELSMQGLSVPMLGDPLSTMGKSNELSKMRTL